MTKLHLAAALLLAIPCCAAWAADAPNLTGNWTIHQNVDGNESSQECKWVQADGKLSGTCKGTEDKERAVTGTVNGNVLKWQYDSEYEGTPLTVKCTATLKDAENISGTVFIEPYGVDGEFTASPSKTVENPR